jgi:nucleoside-diphosphate-sugar epimerase
MRILFTGASSFTGYWFVRALAEAGHEVVCPLRGGAEAYDGVRAQRVTGLKPLCRLVADAPFGSDNFLKLIHENGPWDLLCHHAADVTNYKSADFDVQRALLNNTLNLRAVLAAFKPAGIGGVLLTGSVFENDEGIGEEPLRAFSPYGLSKGLTWQAFRYYCGEAGLLPGKFVIPNPFGPLEEPRFTAYLLRCWREGKPAEVKTPDYVRDNIHVDLLAASYAKHATDLVSLPTGGLRVNPSGYAERQGEFAARVAREVRARSSLKCELILGTQTDFSEPRQRLNTQPVAAQFPAWSETKAWDAFVKFYGV